MSNEEKDRNRFTLTYSPESSSRYHKGYWYAYAEPGFDGDGETPEAAMGALIIQMSEYLTNLGN